MTCLRSLSLPEQMQLLEIEETMPAQVATSSVLVSHPLPGENTAGSIRSVRKVEDCVEWLAASFQQRSRHTR